MFALLLNLFLISFAVQVRNVMYYGFYFFIVSVFILFFSDWSIYGGEGEFYPQFLPGDKFTHLNYAFLDFDGNGDIVLPDPDAALATPLGKEGTTWGDPNAGIISGFLELRAKYPNLKLGASIGGWTRSGDFSLVAANDNLRAHLVDGIIRFTEYCNFDFVDIDWEYPNAQRDPDTVDNRGDEGTPNGKFFFFFIYYNFFFFFFFLFFFSG
jgi:chitinase